MIEEDLGDFTFMDEVKAAWTVQVRAEAELAAVEQQLMDRLNAEDKNNFKEATKAWLAFREAASKFEGEYKGAGGTSARLYAPACALRMTQARIAELKHLTPGG
jgi:uncharacterized protein YecT (DUF1311 family)